MFRKFLIFVFVIGLVFVSLRITVASTAGDVEECKKELEELKSSNDAGDLSEKIGECDQISRNFYGQQKKTLANEIAYFDSQINLTELKIQNSIAEIDKRTKLLEQLISDIAGLQIRINTLSESIDYQRNVLGERVRARYKSGLDSPFYVLFGSTTLDTLVKKTEYLKVMQVQDQLLLDEMERTKAAYTQQKDLFEEKKAETEKLKANLELEKANLETYRIDLDGQKAAKQSLLQKTQNDEAKFQELLADARRELAQIVGAATVLRGTKPQDVEKGDVIGTQGTSGYSTGPHLHFGVYRYSSIDDIAGWNWYYSNMVDPAKKLKSKSVTWDEGCGRDGNKSTGSGNWRWPMDGFVLTQGYGHTCYSDSLYDGNPHPAFDLAGSIGSPVFAVDDGRAYSCRNCLGDGGNGVFIFHDDDYMTVYWHLR